MLDLVALFSKPPASLAWAVKEGRQLGASDGFLLDLWPDRVEAAAIFPPNRPQLAARNATLFLLLLAAVRPTWRTLPEWLVETMRLARRYRPTETQPIFNLLNTEYQVRLTWDASASRATLQVAR